MPSAPVADPTFAAAATGGASAPSGDPSIDTATVNAAKAAGLTLQPGTYVVNKITDASGRTVHVAGTLSRLQGGLPDWDPGATVLTRVDATHWQFVADGYEGTQLEYKYTLGDWDHVEKDNGCGEIGNRTLTLAYGATGNQTAPDTVQNWRNVAPCGN